MDNNHTIDFLVKHIINNRYLFKYIVSYQRDIYRAEYGLLNTNVSLENQEEDGERPKYLLLFFKQSQMTIPLICKHSPRSLRNILPWYANSMDGKGTGKRAVPCLSYGSIVSIIRHGIKDQLKINKAKQNHHQQVESQQQHKTLNNDLLLFEGWERWLIKYQEGEMFTKIEIMGYSLMVYLKMLGGYDFISYLNSRYQPSIHLNNSNIPLDILKLIIEDKEFEIVSKLLQEHVYYTVSRALIFANDSNLIINVLSSKPHSNPLTYSKLFEIVQYLKKVEDVIHVITSLDPSKDLPNPKSFMFHDMHSGIQGLQFIISYYGSNPSFGIDYFRLYVNACEKGMTDIVSWVYELVEHLPSELSWVQRSDYQRTVSAKHCHFDVMKLIKARFPTVLHSYPHYFVRCMIVQNRKDVLQWTLENRILESRLCHYLGTSKILLDESLLDKKILFNDVPLDMVRWILDNTYFTNTLDPIKRSFQISCERGDKEYANYFYEKLVDKLNQRNSLETRISVKTSKQPFSITMLEHMNKNYSRVKFEFHKEYFEYLIQNGHMDLILYHQNQLEVEGGMNVASGQKNNPVIFTDKSIEIAAENGHLDIVRFLVEKPGYFKLKVIESDMFYSTFTKALIACHLPIIKYLWNYIHTLPTPYKNNIVLNELMNSMSYSDHIYVREYYLDWVNKQK